MRRRGHALRRRYGRAESEHVDVFRNLRSVWKRDGKTRRGYLVGLIVRGISHEVFRSGTYSTEEQAQAAATRWLKKHPRYIDTTGRT